MDDRTRFDQLEEIIVELLHKQDRTIEEVGRLREAVANQQLLLARIQNDLNRLEVESATTRRLVSDAVRILTKGFNELTAAQARNERLIQETASILAANALFQQETREALAVNALFQQETRKTLAVNALFQQETRETLAENRAFQQETREALSETRTTLTKILDLLTKP